MDYQKHYNLLIERAKTRIIPEGTYIERHHIVPKCMGGTNKKYNLVKLTAKEHFVAHLLLVKIYPNNNKLIYAAVMMCANSLEHKRTNSRYYSWLRNKHASLSKGKTYEEIYGEEEGKRLRKIRSESRKGKTYKDMFEDEDCKRLKEACGSLQRGKTYEELYEPEKAKKLKLDAKNRQKGKTYEEIHGEEEAKRLKKLRSSNLKGKKKPTFTKTHRENLSNSHKGKACINKGLKTYVNLETKEEKRFKKDNVDLNIWILKDDYIKSLRPRNVFNDGVNNFTLKSNDPLIEELNLKMGRIKPKKQ